MAKWVSDKNAVPPIFHDLKAGRKTVATVRRVRGRMVKGRARYDYQVIRQFVGIMGHAVGPVFPTLAAAKRHAEAKVSE